MSGVVWIILLSLLTLDGAIARGGHCLLATDGRGYKGPDADSEAEPSPGLSAFGYRQSLHRLLRSLSLYALTFSSLGVLLSSVLLIGPYWAAARGGAVWAYAAGALICQTLIALVFAELVAEYPVSGSVYNWTKKLAPAPLKWMSGWLFTSSGLVGISAGGLALATLLPRISPVFQLVGTGAGTYDFSENAVLLGSATMLFAGAVNVIGVRFLGRTNQVGAAVEVATIMVAVVALLVHARHGPGVAAYRDSAGTGLAEGYIGALLLAFTFTMSGFYGEDEAAMMSEETSNPRRAAPRAMLRVTVGSAMLGIALIFAGFMAIPRLGDPQVLAGGFPYIIEVALGRGLGDAILWGAVVAVLASVLTAVGYTARAIFAMARDDQLPFSRRLAYIGRSGTPVLPILVLCLTNIAILAVNVRQPAIVLVVLSCTAVLIYLAYLIAIAALLVQRLRGRWPRPDSQGQAHFSLGRWGLPVNAAAAVVTLVTVVTLAWPRPEVYDPAPPFHWYLRFGGIILPVFVVGTGVLYYAFVQRGKPGAVLPAHRSRG
jgi:urea carboxylase system permease